MQPSGVGARRTGMPVRRNISLLVAGNGLSLLGDGMFVVAIGFAVFAVGGGAGALGVILLAGVATIFACSSRIFAPAFTPGPLTTKGTRRLWSYMFCFPNSP